MDSCQDDIDTELNDTDEQNIPVIASDSASSLTADNVAESAAEPEVISESISNMDDSSAGSDKTADENAGFRKYRNFNNSQK